ncbi:MAG TPA: hypothetical protein VMT28_16935 [Terriglobales bacterium]|nr:hypothetical protein [Terriglobales bacterium]
MTAGANSDALPPFALPSGNISLPGSAMVPLADRTTAPALTAPVTLPRMSPELALQAYERRLKLQSAELVSYDSTTLIRAALLDTSQYGEFELQRHYAAPRTLQFKAVRFTGDHFVKSNVITRLLQSEVDHVQKDDASLTALTSDNYKFSFKGTSEIQGRVVHIYQVKPRKKRAGLFKGRVYLDAHTGSLVRAEGSLVKSPSFFIRKIEFEQDYADIGGFTFPVHIHSQASARIVGRAVVDIYQSNYQPVTNVTESTQLIPSL